MKPQRLYWLAELVEVNAANWTERKSLLRAVTRDVKAAKDAVTDEELAAVLSWLHAGSRIEYKPGRGNRDMIRAAPTT
jgi:hypothetical protein